MCHRTHYLVYTKGYSIVHSEAILVQKILQKANLSPPVCQHSDQGIEPLQAREKEIVVGGHENA